MRARRGPRPATTARPPHRQLDQQPGEQLALRLREQLGTARAHVRLAPSAISVPGATALVLDERRGPAEAYLIGNEFAHLHPWPDVSLHMALPRDQAEDVIAAGWAELHPEAAAGRLPSTLVMVYAPRDDDEIAVVLGLLSSSHCFATGGTT
jgi:hypothetical protein